MAASSSSSTVVDDEVVEVEVGDEVLNFGVASELDPSTYSVFFSDGDGVGAKSSWPAAEAIASKLTDPESVRVLCVKYGVPDVYKPVCAGRSAASKTPEEANALCVYAAALEAGLRFPLHEFYAKLLRHYQLAPSQLAPNSWSYMVAFVRLCEDAGVEPQVSVFRYFFAIYAHKDKGVPVGWHHFQPTSPNRRLFSGSPQNKFGWKSKFFFLESSPTTSWKCPVKWGKPRRADVHKQQDRNVIVETLQRKAGRAGEREDLMKFLSRRGFPVGTLIDPEQMQASMKAESAGKRKAPEDTSSVATPALQQEQGLIEPVSLGQGFDLIQGGSEGQGQLPHRRMWATDSRLQLWETEYQKNQYRLQEALRLASIENAGLKQELYDVKVQASKLLKEANIEIFRLKGVHAAERAHLNQRISASESKVKQLEEQVSSAAGFARLEAEHAASLVKLNEKHAADMARVKDTTAKEVQAAEARIMKNVMFALFPDGNIDTSLLKPAEP